MSAISASGLTDDVLAVTGPGPVSLREFAEREATQWATGT